MEISPRKYHFVMREKKARQCLNITDNIYDAEKSNTSQVIQFTYLNCSCPPIDSLIFCDVDSLPFVKHQ